MMELRVQGHMALGLPIGSLVVPFSGFPYRILQTQTVKRNYSLKGAYGLGVWGNCRL